MRELIRSVCELQTLWKDTLGQLKNEIDGMVRIVEEAMSTGLLGAAKIRTAVAALAYLRNPYDHIFDLYGEGGFIDDQEVIREAWASINKER